MNKYTVFYDEDTILYIDCPKCEPFEYTSSLFSNTLSLFWIFFRFLYSFDHSAKKAALISLARVALASSQKTHWKIMIIHMTS